MGAHEDLTVSSTLHMRIRASDESSSGVYLSRAVDRQGWTLDFYLSRNRDVEIAKHFLRTAMKNQWVATKITLDATPVKQRLQSILGLTSFGAAVVVTISEIELTETIQFKVNWEVGPQRCRHLASCSRRLVRIHRKIKIGQSIVLPIPESTSDS